MKRPIIIILSVIVVFVLLGTSLMYLLAPRYSNTFSTVQRNLGYGGGTEPMMLLPAATQAPAAQPSAAEGFAPEDAARQSLGDGVQTQERIVIQNADLSIVVKDPAGRMKEISKLAEDMGGFVVSSNLSQSFTPAGKEVPQASIMIRVPAAKLDEALDKIKAGAVDIQYENRSGQDVTSQYVDLQSQLTAKEAAEKKLLEILDKAEKAEDVLAIYLQVQNVQTEIEQLKGQIKYLEESAALSAINVTLIAEESTQPIEVGPWKPQGAARDAIQDLILFFQRFVDFLIRFVLYNLPALILIAIPLYLLFLGGHAVYRRVRKSNVKVEEKEEEKK